MVRLTPRQNEVCQLLVTEGLTNKEMALRMGISPRTVECYRTEIYLKFDVRSALQLVRKVLLSS